MASFTKDLHDQFERGLTPNQKIAFGLTKLGFHGVKKIWNNVHIAIMVVWGWYLFQGFLTFSMNTIKMGFTIHSGFYLLGIALYIIYVRFYFKKLRPRKLAKVHNVKMENIVYSIMEKTIYKDENPKKSLTIAVNENGVWLFNFRTPHNYKDDDVLKLTEPIKSALGFVSGQKLDLDPRAGYVTIAFSATDLSNAHLDSSLAPVLTLSNDEISNPYLWLPVGMKTVEGSPFKVPLFMKTSGSVRAIVAGMSGSGKSSIMSQQLLFATKCPYIDVYVTDFKQSEFGAFQPYVTSYETDRAGFFKQLKALEEEVVRRGKVLAHNHATQDNRWSDAWNLYDDGNLAAWFLDEPGIGWVTADPRTFDEIQSRLFGVLSVSRSLGIAVVFSSQTWNSQILDTKTRDLCFDIRTGYALNKLQDSIYLGFTSEDVIRPDLINAKLDETTGTLDKVGVFASSGLVAAYGKAFYIPKKIIRDDLAHSFYIQPRIEKEESNYPKDEFSL